MATTEYMYMRRLLLPAILSTLFALNLSAQGERGDTRRRDPVNPEEIAEQKTTTLERELSLSEKQRKKVYKLYLKETKDAQSEMKGRQPGPPLTDRSGTANRPPEGRQRSAQTNRQNESTETIEKREEKMKKILDTGQYNRWLELEKETRNRQFQEKLLQKN